jgi:hypothetical protein
MEIRFSNDEYSLVLPEAQAMLLASSLNELLLYWPDPKFFDTMGWSHADAEAFLNDLSRGMKLARNLEVSSGD